MSNACQNHFETGQLHSAVKWAIAGFVGLGLVTTIAIVAIICAIIDSLKKLESAITNPIHDRTTANDVEKASKVEPSSNHLAIIMSQDLQIQFTTMERFLSNMAKEQPIRFSPEQIKEITKNYSTVLGSGGYGVVFKGDFPNGVQVAVKVLTYHSNKRVLEQLMAEMCSIGRTYHVNLVRLYGFCFDPSVMALIYEYMENGSLNRFLFDDRREIDWEKLQEIAIGTAKGIAYLHEDCEQRIIHYDIKPENILLDQNLNPKIADFGLAKLCKRERSHVTMSGGRGTIGYSAPEVWRLTYPVTHKCDVYSFGILLFEIIGRRRHFVGNLTESCQWLPRWTWDMYKNNELSVMLALCGIEEKDKVKAERMSVVALLCIQYSPDSRPLMSDVVKMLEGRMEITKPENPFEFLDSTRLSFTMYNGSNEDIISTQAAEKISEQSYFKS